MMDSCALYSRDAEESAIGTAVICWRGECLVCGWEKSNMEYRKADLKARGLSEATPEEVKAFLKKHRHILCPQAVAYIKQNGLRFYRVRRELRR